MTLDCQVRHMGEGRRIQRFTTNEPASSSPLLAGLECSIPYQSKRICQVTAELYVFFGRRGGRWLAPSQARSSLPHWHDDASDAHRAALQRRQPAPNWPRSGSDAQRGGLEQRAGRSSSGVRGAGVPSRKSLIA
jgi:hypothetical protein